MDAVNKDMRICLVRNCGARISSIKGNCVGMKNHLKKHNIVPSNVCTKPVNQQSITGHLVNRLQAKNFDTCLTKLACVSLIPPFKIEHDEQLVDLIMSKYRKKPTQYLVWSSVEKIYKLMVNEIKAKIHNSMYVSVTTDDWTSGAAKGFANINIYTISNSDKDGEKVVEKYSLGVVEVKDQSGAGLAKMLQTRLSEFDAKTLFVTSDGASNIAKACRLGGFLQQKCFVHAIDLFVKDFIGRKLVYCDESDDEESDDCDSVVVEGAENDEVVNQIGSAEVEVLSEESNSNYFESHDISRIVDDSGELYTSIRTDIARIRKVFVILKRSTKLRNELRKYNSLSPILDVPTRWSSTFQMLERYIKLHKSIQKVVIDNNEHRLQCNVDVEDIQMLVELLRPLSLATTELSAGDANLMTADFILAKYSLQLPPLISQKFLERVLARRNKWSDILLYLTKQQHLVPFYEEPEEKNFEEVYSRVFFIFS